MTAREISELKTNMPLSVPAGISAGDLHDVVDTLDERTTQRISVKTASYTAVSADNRSKICFDSSASVTLTLPSTTPAGWECLSAQMGTGQVMIEVPSGVLLSRGGRTKAAGRYAVVYLLCVSNPGTSPQIVVTGDVVTELQTASSFMSGFSSAFS